MGYTKCQARRVHPVTAQEIYFLLRGTLMPYRYWVLTRAIIIPGLYLSNPFKRIAGCPRSRAFARPESATTTLARRNYGHFCDPCSTLATSTASSSTRYTTT